jgi:hypothetical protein
MKNVLCCLTFLIFPGLLGDSAVAEMHGWNDLAVRVLEASHSAKVRVSVLNTSKEPLRIWKDSNSWGAARWRILVLRNGQLQTFFQNPDRDFTVNLPTFVEIAGGSHLEQSLDLNDGNWRGSERERVIFNPGDTVVVVYDVPFTPESLKLGVWYGVATTSTVVR